MTRWPHSAPAVSPCFRLAPDVLLQPAGDEALLVKLNAEDVFGLNATALLIVQQIAGGLSLEQATEALAASYAADREVIAADVRELVETLVNRNLLLQTNGQPDGEPDGRTNG